MLFFPWIPYQIGEKSFTYCLSFSLSFASAAASLKCIQFQTHNFNSQCMELIPYIQINRQHKDSQWLFSLKLNMYER